MFHFVTPQKGQIFTIGRKENCDLHFSDIFVSRNHAEIEYKDSKWILRNLSENSITLLNEQKIKESILKDGDILIIGLHQIRITLNGHKLSLLILDFDESIETYPLKSTFSEILLNVENETKLKIKVREINNQAELLFVNKVNNSKGKHFKRIFLNSNNTIQVENFKISYNQNALFIKKVIKGFNVFLKDVDVFAQKKKLLEQINFQLGEGEILAIIGRSGQGKSSLLKLFKGEYSKNSNGRVLFASTDYTHKEIRKRVSILSQDPKLFNNLTIYESLLYGAKISMNRNEFNNSFKIKANRILDLFGLSHRVNNKVKTLSGGELKRLALAIELMGEPGLIILDEPLSGLDSYNSSILCSHLKQLSFLGHTIIFTTHSFDSLKIANKVLVIHQGEQCFYGTQKESYNFFKTENTEGILNQLNDESGIKWRESHINQFERHKEKQFQLFFLKNKKNPLFFNHVQMMLIQWFRDKGKLLALILQPILIGFIFSQIFSTNSSLLTLSFSLILCANWFALSLSIREIVQEKEIILKEMNKGLGINSYLLSKIITPSIVSTLQSLIVFLFIIFKTTLHPSLPLLIGIFITTILPATTMGIFVSSLSKNPGQANAFLPLIIIPQIALAGALIPIDQMETIGRVLSYAIWSRYNQGSLLDLFLERPLDYFNLFAPIFLSLIFYIFTLTHLFQLRKAK